MESYALESVWSIISAISYAIANPAVVLFMGSDSTIKVCVAFGEINAFTQHLTYLGYCLLPRCLSGCDRAGVYLTDKGKAHDLEV